MNIGAPIDEVITPTGSCAGAIIVLDIRSAKTKIIDPKIAEQGIKYLWIGPMVNLTKCGVTKPMKPIMPQKETVIPTIKEDINIINFFNLSTSIPKWYASASPNIKISNLSLIKKTIMKQPSINA